MAVQPNLEPLVKPAAQRLARQLQAGGGATQDSSNPDRGTPGWWRNRLLELLFLRRQRLDVYEAYYDGQHRLAFATEKFREAFGMLFGAFADNWCDLVVDASVERLGVEGFRFGRDAQADDAAWNIWQRNGLDAESHLAHTEAVKLGVSYILVGPDPEEPGKAAVQVEHPDFAIVELDPANPRERRAGLRHWVDQVEGLDYCVLYLPDRVYWWQRDAQTTTVTSANPVPLLSLGSGWEAAPGTGRNPLGEVPLVPLLNKQKLRDRGGSSDLARVIPLQDAINKLVTDMIVASEFAAYRQRTVSGIEIPKDPQTGRPLPGFEPGSSRLWAVADPNVKWGEFQASDLSNYVTAVEALIQHVAAQTRTPPHYLLGSSGNFPSGESLKATETGLVAKVRAKHRGFGEAWEEAMRLAFLLEGDQTRGNAMDAETIWRNPESRSEAEITDAAVKKGTIGVPQEALWEYMGASPQQIKRWKKMREEEARLGQVNAPMTIRATEQLGPQAGQPATGSATQQAGAMPAPTQPGVTPGAPQAPSATPAR